MILGLLTEAYTLIHVLISLIAIAAGVTIVAAIKFRGQQV